LELKDSEQDRFFAAFEDVGSFQEDLRLNQRLGKVVRSERFGLKERRFGGGLRHDSDAAQVYFERFRRSRLIFIAAVDLGYRVSDLRFLTRAAVDLTRGAVSIATRKTGEMAVVALSDRCRSAVEEAMSKGVGNTEYVFTTDEGQPYSESTLRRYFALAKQFAGITRRCRLNDLRHTFASNLASEGLSLLDIRDALGHTTGRMSERYAKPNDRALERMREALNARQQRQEEAASPRTAKR
jgi:integrase